MPVGEYFQLDILYWFVFVGRVWNFRLIVTGRNKETLLALHLEKRRLFGIASAGPVPEAYRKNFRRPFKRLFPKDENEIDLSS